MSTVRCPAGTPPVGDLPRYFLVTGAQSSRSVAAPPECRQHRPAASIFRRIDQWWLGFSGPTARRCIVVPVAAVPHLCRNRVAGRRRAAPDGPVAICRESRGNSPISGKFPLVVPLPIIGGQLGHERVVGPENQKISGRHPASTWRFGGRFALALGRGAHLPLDCRFGRRLTRS